MKFSRFMTAALCSAAVLAGAAETAAKPASANAVPAKPAPAPVAPAGVTPEIFFAPLPEVLVTFKGGQLTKGEFIAAIKSELPDGKIPEQLKFEVVAPQLPEMLKGMIISKLVEQEAKAQGFLPSQAETEKMLKEQLKNMPPEVLQRIQAEKKITLDQIVQDRAKNPAVQQQVATARFVKAQIDKNVKPATEAEAKKYYQENKSQFTEPADDPNYLRASHILVLCEDKEPPAVKKEKETKINQLLAEVKKNPAKFAEIAAANSDCPSKQRGGELGAFPPEQMVPEFSKAVQALKPGEISGVVKTQYGFHIIRREELRKEQEIPFEKVKQEVVALLTQNRQQEYMQKFIQGLEKKNNVKVLYQPPKPPAPTPVAAPEAAK